MRNTTLGFAVARERSRIQWHLGLRPAPTPAADIASAAPHIVSLGKRAADVGVPLGFVVIPDRRQLPRPTAGARASLPSYAPAKPDLDRRVELALTHLEATQGQIIDLTPQLHDQDVREIFFPTDGHLSARGHEVVAQRLEPWLRARFPTERHIGAH